MIPSNPTTLRISEKAFLRQVIELAGYAGWKIYHTWSSLHSAAGFPDLVLCKTLPSGETIAIMAELKSERGKLTPHQVKWLELLDMIAGVFVFVWIPSHFVEISEVLQAQGLPDIIEAWKKHAPFARSHFGLNLPTQKNG